MLTSMKKTDERFCKCVVAGVYAIVSNFPVLSVDTLRANLTCESDDAKDKKSHGASDQTNKQTVIGKSKKKENNIAHG